MVGSNGAFITIIKSRRGKTIGKETGKTGIATGSVANYQGEGEREAPKYQFRTPSAGQKICHRANLCASAWVDGRREQATRLRQRRSHKSVEEFGRGSNHSDEATQMTK